MLEPTGYRSTGPRFRKTGLRLIAEGWPNFVDELLAYVPPDVDVLIVDGVRHISRWRSYGGDFPMCRSNWSS